MRSAEGARVVETTGEGLAPESAIIASRDHAGRVKVLVAAGARPNFVKVAPLMRSLRRRPLFGASLIHTGQHDDPMLSSVESERRATLVAVPDGNELRFDVHLQGERETVFFAV